MEALEFTGFSPVGAGIPQNQAELEDLLKALTAGNSINAPSFVPGEGFAMRTESLERTLKNLTFREQHVKFWRDIPKMEAYNTVEEHNVINSYGQMDVGFVAEGELPTEDDTSYERKYAQIKYMGLQGKISHPMTLIRSANGNIIAQETNARTMQLLKMIEKQLFEADSSLSALQFDGLRKLITAGAPAANLIDLRGRPLDEDTVHDACARIGDSPGFGTPTDLYMSVLAKSDFAKQFYSKERMPVGNQNGTVGFLTKAFDGPNGIVSLNDDVFVDDGGRPPAAAGPSVNAARIPSAPTLSTGVTTPPDAGSLFLAPDAGTYDLYATAHNDYGNSAPLAIGANAVAAGDKITFGLTPAGSPATKWYQIYMTKAGVTGAANARLIARIPNVSGVGAQTINLFYEKIPFTTEAYLIQRDLQCLSWKQLAPFLKIPLATIDPSVRWMMLLYGVLVLYAPAKTVLFKNIGRVSGSV